MKTMKLVLIAIFTFFLFFAGCMVNVSVNQNAVVTADPTYIKLISGVLLAVYELTVRIIPSVGDYSVVSWVIRYLKKISDSLNSVK